MDVTIGTKTDAGKRENNEDAVLVVQPNTADLGADAIVIVADGMGGRASGEEASSLAVTSIRDTLLTLLKPSPTMPSYEEALTTAMRRANSAVYELARANTTSKGMGTTCVAAVIGKGSIAIAHVGDSRAYMLRDGLLRRLTDDHSYIHDQVKSGHLSDHDARHSRFRHVITKAIGIEAMVKPDIQLHAMAKGDSFLLCTDGMSNIVDEAGMIQIMSRARSAQEGVEYLVDAAIRGGSKDNVTGALMRIGIPDHPDAIINKALKQIEIEGINEDGTTPSHSADDDIDDTETVVLPSRPVLPWFLLGAVLGALIAAGALLFSGHVKGLTNAKTRKPVMAVAKLIDVDNLVYSAPRLLLIQPVIANLIAGSDAGVVVAEAETGNLLSISPSGEVRPAGHIDPKGSSTTGDRYMATDTRGYVYLTTPAVKMIRRVTPDGTIQRPIAQDLLDKPEALYIAKDGSIYVIDDGRLHYIKATPIVSAVPASGKPAGDARANSGPDATSKPASGAN